MLHHMHFHSNPGNEDAHASLKKGTVEIRPVFETLKMMNLYPQITFEIFDREDLYESVEYFKEVYKEVYGVEPY